MSQEQMTYTTLVVRKICIIICCRGILINSDSLIMQKVMPILSASDTNGTHAIL